MNDQAQPEQKLVIDLKTAEAIINYLAQRPYVEVFQLIAAMQQLRPLPAPETEPYRLPTNQGGVALANTQSELVAVKE